MGRGTPNRRASSSPLHEVSTQQIGVVVLGQYIGGELRKSAYQIHRPHEAGWGPGLSDNITNYKVQS